MTDFELVSVLTVIAALFGWISVRVLRLPLTIGTVLLTVAGGLTLEAISAYVPSFHSLVLGMVHQIDFEKLILHAMLSLLLFAGAFLLDIEQLYHERLIVGVLAVVGTLFTAAVMTLLMHWTLRLFGQPGNWYACMFFGALISPTDPIAVLEMLGRVGAPAHLKAQLAGESLFNDGIGAVLFLSVLSASRGQQPTLRWIGGLLLLEVGAALLLGISLAWATSRLMRAVNSFQVEILLTLAAALGGYALADHYGLSAPLYAVSLGIALRWFNSRLPKRAISNDSLDRFWEVIDEVQNALLFVLLGLELLTIRFRTQFLYTGGAAILYTIVVRVVMLVLLIAAVVQIRKWLSIRHEHHDDAGKLVEIGHRDSVTVLAWGGLRGGLSLALALAVPYTAANAWILPTTYAVVVFSIVVQGWTMDRFLQRFRAKQETVTQGL